MNWARIIIRVLKGIMSSKSKNRPIFWAWEINRLMESDLDEGQLLFLLDTIQTDWIWYEEREYLAMVEKITRKRKQQ